MTQTTTPSNAELAAHMQKIAFAVEEIVTEVKRHNDKLNALAAAVGAGCDDASSGTGDVGVCGTGEVVA